MSIPKSATHTLISQATDTADICWSFLNARDTERLSRSCKHYKTTFGETITEKKKASELLTHVFNADPKMVREYLAQHAISDSKESEASAPLKKHKTLKKTSTDLCLVLTKSSCREEYYCPSERQTKVKRIWGNISPLEAAAWCGDIFLVRELLKHIPSTQKPESYKQLNGILERKESEEHGSFMAPYEALIQAYENFIQQHNDLYAVENWDGLNKHWNEVWQKQRLFPTYGLQEYCDEKPFHPVPSFDQSPNRSCYVYNDPNHILDLDAMEFGWALGKGDRARVAAWQDRSVAGVILLLGRGMLDMQGAKFIARVRHDLAAITRLYELRILELYDIIQELEGPKIQEESDCEDDKDSSLRP